MERVLLVITGVATGAALAAAFLPGEFMRRWFMITGGIAILGIYLKIYLF